MLMTKNSIINKGVFTKSTKVSDMTSRLLISSLPLQAMESSRINPCCSKLLDGLVCHVKASHVWDLHDIDVAWIQVQKVTINQ